MCFLTKIKDKKMNTLKENFKYLEDLLKILEEIITNIKKVSEKINERKRQKQ